MPWLCHQAIELRTSFAYAGFATPRATRIDHQVRQQLMGLSTSLPAQGIDKTNPIDVDVLAPSRLSHYQTYQIIDQRKDDQLFEHPVDGLTFEHIEAHRRFQVPEIRLNAPPREEQLSEVLKAIELGIEQRGH